MKKHPEPLSGCFFISHNAILSSNKKSGVFSFCFHWTTVLLNYVTSSRLPTPWANFTLSVFLEKATQKEHLVISLGDLSTPEPVLLRLHSECLTGDALFSLRCDCGPQLEKALQRIADEGRGAILYLRQEGRGIGLINKIRAYHLQDQGADTVEANEQLGFHADERNYELIRPMLDFFNIKTIRLMTNNPRKVKALEDLGYTVTERIEHRIEPNPYNRYYLHTKALKLGHFLDEPEA